jgi:hypothetical protein
MILTRFAYNIDFKELFRNGHSRGVDLMRPKGGKYPGISSEVDRSLGEAGEGENIEEDYSFQSYDGKAAYDAEMLNAQQQVEPHSIWMNLDEGKPGHKKTILRLFMDPALDVDYNKSHDRLLRVRYFSIGGHGDKWDRSKPSSSVYEGTSNSNLFRLGSLYATLICTNNKVCVAVLQCTLLKSASQYLDRAPIDEIALLNSAYDVTGQIFSLLPALGKVNDSFTAQSEVSWVWNAKFIALDTVKTTARQQPSSTTRLRHLSFSVNGRLVYPLRPSQFKSVPISALPCTLEALPSTMEQTWIIAEKDLKDIECHLFRLVREEEDARFKIPVFGQVREGSFPYCAVIGASNLNLEVYQWYLYTFSLAGATNPATIEHSTTSIAVPSSDAPQGCRVCSRQVSGPDRQSHMGRHILRKLRGVNENFQSGGTEEMAGSVCPPSSSLLLHPDTAVM